MPIEFHHDAPVAALATLAQQAGAVDAARKRRTELEAMNMQMVKMQKQEQQQNLNRVADVWRTQYSEASAMQKMKAEHQFRDVQQDKAEAQQMKGWELQQGGMDRRQDAGNVAAMKHQQEQYRLRGDEASIKAADDMNHDIITMVGGTLNGTGRAALTDLIKKMRDMRASQKVDPKQKPAEEAKIMQQVTELRRDPLNTVTLPGEDGYRLDLGPVSRVTKGGQEHYVPNYHPKKAWGPYIKATEEQHGIGETRDINGDGIPDQVSTAVWEFDDMGQPKMSKVDWVDVKPGAPEKTRFEIDRERGTFFNNVLERGKGLDDLPGVLKLKPGAPPELRTRLRIAQSNPQRAQGTPDEKDQLVEDIVGKYYEEHSRAPGAQEAPGAPRAPEDPAQEEIQVRPEDLQRGRDDLVEGADQRIHRALATGDRPGAKMVDRYQKIASDPNMDPATKRADLQRMLQEQEERLRGSGEFRDLKDRGEPGDMQRMPDREEPVDMQMLENNKKKGAPVNRGAGQQPAPAAIADAVRPFSLNKGKRRGKRFGQGGGADLKESIAGLRPHVQGLIDAGTLDQRDGELLLAQLNVKFLAGIPRESYVDWAESLEKRLGVAGSKKKGAPVNRGGDKERKMATSYADLFDMDMEGYASPVTRGGFEEAWWGKDGWREKFKRLGMPDNHEILRLSPKALGQKDKESHQKWVAGVKGALKRFAEGKGW